MNKPSCRSVHALLLLAVTLLLSGCLAATKTATLYSLQLIDQPPLASPPNLAGMVLVMPVQVAAHLQGRSILFQQTNGESRAAATHLWAATLDKQIGQKVTSHLQHLLASADIALFPGPRYGVSRYQVEIEIEEFSGNGQTFTALATYTLSDRSTKRILVRKRFQQNRPIDKPDYSGYVAAASRAVADLSREIAAALSAKVTSTSTP